MLGTTSVASYYGPSFMIDDLIYHYPEADHHTVLINCHYPIDANSFVLQYGIIVKKSEHCPTTWRCRRRSQLGDFVKIGFEQDVAIWRNKARIDNPLLCEEDGPVYQLRRWYEQFYVDAADVTPEMVDRFEFEIDTTRPREQWMQGSGGEHGGEGRPNCSGCRASAVLMTFAPTTDLRTRRWFRCRAGGAPHRCWCARAAWDQTSVQWSAAGVGAVSGAT